MALVALTLGLTPRLAVASDAYQLLQSFPASNGVAGPGGGLLGPVVARTDTGQAGWALYGVASRGGLVYRSSDPAASSCPSGCGIVYKLTPPPPGDDHWTVVRLYVFKGGLYGDSAAPRGSLTFDASGAAYGVAHDEVFRLTPPQAGQYFWNKTALRKIGADALGGPYVGGFPQSSVILDAAGSLYGTAGGGQDDSGIIYRLTPPVSGSGPWSETVLHRFLGPHHVGSDYPYDISSGPLIIDAAGSIYGVFTYQGDPGLGEVFKLTPPKTGQSEWTYSTLYRPEIHGYYLAAMGLVRDAAGSLYFTLSGGPNAAGAVMGLTPPSTAGTAWTPTILSTFSGPDGTNPGDLAILDRSGSVYGATDARIVQGSTGSRYLGGVVFRLDPPRAGQTAWTRTVLDALPAGVAEGDVTRDASGAIYTTGGPAPPNTDGAIFKLTPQ